MSSPQLHLATFHPSHLLRPSPAQVQSVIPMLSILIQAIQPYVRVFAGGRVLRGWHRVEKPSVALRPRRFFYHGASAMASPSIFRGRAHCPCLCMLAHYVTLEQDPSLSLIINPPFTQDQGNPLTREFSADSSIIIQRKAFAIVLQSENRSNWACAPTEQHSTVALRCDNHS